MRKSLLIAALLGLTACGKFDMTGTETGNALSPDSGTMPLEGAATTLTSGLCDAIAACHPSANVSECQEQLEAQSGIPQLFGVPQSTGILTMNSLGQGNLAVTVSPENASACATGIESIGCSSQEQQDAFINDSYSGATALISAVAACGSVYSAN